MIFTQCAPLALVIFLVPAAARSAPAGQAAANVGAGKQLFQGMCGRCHGIDGTGEEGPNLARPTLTRAADDDSLRAIIRDGIPERGMPRVRRMTDTELDQLVAYVRVLGRSPAATSTGNAQRGGEIYKRLGCASCHIIQCLRITLTLFVAWPFQGRGLHENVELPVAGPAVDLKI